MNPGMIRTGVGPIDMTASSVRLRPRLPFLLGIKAFVVPLPFTWAYVVDLQDSGRADDVGMWYTAYSAVLFSLPIGLGAALLGLALHWRPSRQ